MTDSHRLLRVAVLSSAAKGGAGIAARRVTNALDNNRNISADFIDIEAVGESVPQDAAPYGNMSNRRLTDTHFTIEYPGFIRGWLVELLEGYDVINVHWASYLIGLAELDELSRRGIPMLFTLHDYYYITGGCHYPAGCRRMERGCLGCPQVNGDLCDAKAVPNNLKLKERIFSRQNVHLAAPSKFLIDEALRTDIVPKNRTHILRNAYERLPVGRQERSEDTTRIVLIADSLSENRKGMPLALDALMEVEKRLTDAGDSNGLVVEIIGESNEELERILADGAVPYRLHGRIAEHEVLVEVFSHSDYLLTCSYEDNWPNILVEAASYGCVPLVGPGHGCEEFVKEFKVGGVAAGYSSSAFAELLYAAVTDTITPNRRAFAAAVADVHSPQKVSTGYERAIKEVMRAY